ncbi:MAG TPA: thiamine pyrophosphate-dependent dehydrogenase E1 component subunit alpha [Candidatus Dormibacteraeota bacterium]
MADAVAEGVDTERDAYLRIHRWMCQAKALDDRMHMLVRQGRAPFVGSSRGHEGIQVASTAALDQERDWLVPHYRGLANALVLGLTPREWMLAVFAKVDDPLSAGRNIPGGCFSSRRLRIASVSQVVSTWVPKAAGIAYASKVRGDGAAVLCSFGDGGVSEGDWHEGVNFAATHKLPVVFVCENNGYAISVPQRLQSGNPTLSERAAGYGMAGVTVDGTDVPACYAAAVEAVRRARAGEGPTLIEAKVRRINSHTSEDNQAKYRPPAEIEEAALHDPLLRFEDWLGARGWLTAADAQAVRAECDQDAAEAADWAEKQPDPKAEDLAKNLYAD